MWTLLPICKAQTTYMALHMAIRFMIRFVRAWGFLKKKCKVLSGAEVRFALQHLGFELYAAADTEKGCFFFNIIEYSP